MSTTKTTRSGSAPRKSTVPAASKTPRKTAAPKSRAAKTDTADRKVAAVPRESELAGSAAAAQAASPAVSAPAPQVPQPDTALQGGQGDEAVRRRIAEAAYYRAERRGFAPGHEETDWLEAEAEVRGSARPR